MKIILTDTFNDRIISTHRTIKAAVLARSKHLRAVRAANGPSSYLTYSIDADDMSEIGNQVCATESRLYREGKI